MSLEHAPSRTVGRVVVSHRQKDLGIVGMMAVLRLGVPYIPDPLQLVSGRPGQSKVNTMGGEATSGSNVVSRLSSTWNSANTMPRSGSSDVIRFLEQLRTWSPMPRSDSREPI